MDYDVIIIGAGIAGLTASLKLSSQGRKVLLLERQPIPGGYATTFHRGGFIFESSVHCVDALNIGGDIRNFLEETGIDKKVEFIELKNFSRMIYPEHDYICDFNINNFINFLKESFPKEKENIDKLFSDISIFYKQFDNFYALRLPRWIKFILTPFIYPSLLRTSVSTIEQFIQRYVKDAKITAIITDIWRFAGLPPSRLSALYFLLIFKGYYLNPTVYIKGSFTQLFKAIVEEIKKTGSEVKFNTTAIKITTNKAGLVKSVFTDKGEEFKAKVVISNANASDTLTKLIDNNIVKEKYSKKLSSLEKSVSATQVYLGLKIPAKNLGMNCAIFSINPTYSHEDSFNCVLNGDYNRCALEVVDHAQVDSSLVPSGKGSLLIMALDSYNNWLNLEENEYQRKKQEIAQIFISRIEKYLPGLSQYIEVIEVASPRTMQRFTLSPEGAIYGFAQTVEQSGFNRLAQKTEIKGLFLAGGWTWPGAGVHGCFISGIEAANMALSLT